MRSTIALLIGLLPVTMFLVGLLALDSYKLVRLSSMLRMLLAGAFAAIGSLAVNSAVIERGIDTVVLARYIAPVIEETLKAAPIVYLLMRNRIGFLVDAAIRGFAVGAGFAAVENANYLILLHDSDPVLWMVRGFSTAIMHGGVTATMAILAKYASDRRGKTTLAACLLPLLLAASLHSAFNHFVLTPQQGALVLLLGLPVVFMLVFRASQRATRSWLGVGFDTDSELLETMSSGRISETRIGAYLESLRSRFQPEMLVDMLCLIRLHLELSVKAKGILLAREAGFEVKPDREAWDKLDELRHLEKTIGATGSLALRPIFNMSSRDLWSVYLLEK